MFDCLTLFITVTTYGTWLPGDERGRRKGGQGNQEPQPRLAKWCRDDMIESPVILNNNQRRGVYNLFYEHAKIRGWQIHAASVRTRHFHICISVPDDTDPKRVRDQFKANAARVLRQLPDRIGDKTWAKREDIEFIENDESLENVVFNIDEAQDRMEFRM